jgi:hypothetical protein
MGTKEIIFMNYDNLFIFVVTHVKQLGGKGRGVVITRKTTLEEITNIFDTFLLREEIAKLMKFTKETSTEHPNIIIYRTAGSEEHIVFGLSEQGWKDDYGLTHTDVVVSVS